jgi:hypothetical protein
LKRFLIAAALVCVPCFGACSKQGDVVVKTGEDKAFSDADIDRDPLALLPGGAIALSHVDAQQMFASRFGEKLLGLLTSQMPLPASAGFEPRRDLSELYTGVYSMQGADVLGVAIGAFDKQKIQAAADATQKTPQGVPVVKSSYAGRSLYTAGNMGFTVLTQKTLLFGNDTGIRRALDRIQEGRAKRQQPQWMDKLLQTPNAPLVLGADFTSSPVPEAARTQLAFMDGMKTLALVGNFQDPGLNLAGTLSYEADDAAARGAENLLGVRNSLDRYAPFMALLGIPQPVRKLEAQPKEKEVSFVMGVDGAAVGVLLDKAVDFIPGAKASASGG